jgi:hypothetical protein
MKFENNIKLLFEADRPKKKIDFSVFNPEEKTEDVKPKPDPESDPEQAGKVKESEKDVPDVVALALAKRAAKRVPKGSKPSPEPEMDIPGLEATFSPPVPKSDPHAIRTPETHREPATDYTGGIDPDLIKKRAQEAKRKLEIQTGEKFDPSPELGKTAKKGGPKKIDFTKWRIPDPEEEQEVTPEPETKRKKKPRKIGKIAKKRRSRFRPHGTGEI